MTTLKNAKHSKTTLKNISTAVFAVALVCAASNARAALFTPTGIDIFDAGTQVLNNRGDQLLAIDGNLGTFSYLTPSFTAAPQIVALDLGGSKTVDAIRVAKLGDVNGVGGSPGLGSLDSMDLTILFTTDIGPLESRTYLAVTGLSNDAFEPIVTGLSVGSNGPSGVFSATVEVGNDNQDFAVDGHYRLNFDPVGATAVAIRFARDVAASAVFVHYPTFEFEVNELVIPEPSSFVLAALGLVSFGYIGWRRRRRTA